MTKQEIVVRTVAEYIDTLHTRDFQLGLEAAPVTPWYFGQAEPDGKLLPAYYTAGMDPNLEREILRDFRIQVAEFVPTKGLPDLDILLLAHQNGLPTRIMDWTGNPLVALFLAVESMAEGYNGRVWVFNPWAFNDAAHKLSYVPMVDTDYFAKYLVNLGNPEASPLPEAELPMAFRPYRSMRPYNTQDTYFTMHGSGAEAINDLKLFMRKQPSYLVSLEVLCTRKKSIMKELHGLGVTRANVTPGMGAVARTLAYRYSNDYLNAVV